MIVYISYLVFTHSLTSRPSSMRVGDSRRPLRYLSSPLCSILWRLLWLNVFAASPLLVSSLAFSTQKVLMFLSVQLEVSVDCGDHSFLDLVNINPLMGTGNYSAHRIIWSWYTGRWWVGCYIWYNEEGTGRGPSPPRPLLAVPNVTAHPSTASVPTSYYSMCTVIPCAH